MVWVPLRLSDIFLNTSGIPRTRVRVPVGMHVFHINSIRPVAKEVGSLESEDPPSSKSTMFLITVYPFTTLLNHHSRLIPVQI